MQLERIRCSDIRPDPTTSRAAPRDSFDALADSIRRHGVLRPVLLRATTEGYVIVHGEGRWRAAQMAGLDTIPATIVHDVSRELEADCAVQQAA